MGSWPAITLSTCVALPYVALLGMALEHDNGETNFLQQV